MVSKNGPAEWRRFAKAYALAQADPMGHILLNAAVEYCHRVRDGASPAELEERQRTLRSYWDEWERTATEYIRQGRATYFGERVPQADGE